MSSRNQTSRNWLKAMLGFFMDVGVCLIFSVIAWTQFSIDGLASNRLLAPEPTRIEASHAGTAMIEAHSTTLWGS